MLSAPAGTNVYTCLATNVWTAQNGSIPPADAAGKALTTMQNGSFGWMSVPTVSDVAGKAPLSHTHAASDITTGTIPVGRIQKVIGLADLTDVSSKQGSGNAVVMSDTPTITTPVIPSYFTLAPMSSPTAPASGYLRVYAKTGSGICWKDSTGTETCAGSSQASGSTSVSVQANSSSVGSPRSTIDFVDGAGIMSTISDTGSKITVQTAIGPTVQTKAGDQSSSHLLCAAGSTNTLTCSMSPTLTVYTDKMLINLCVTAAVTGATTLNIDSLGQKAVLTAAGGNPSTGDLAAGCRIATYYSATNSFRLPAAGGSSGPSLSTAASVLMGVGGCNNNGQAVYPAWGVSGISTYTCLGPAAMQAALPFPSSGAPQALYYFRIPQDWSSSGTTTFLMRTANASGASGALKYNVAISCPAAGSPFGSPAFNASTSVTTVTAPAGTYADVTFTGLDMSGCSAGAFAVVQVARDNTVAGNAAGDDAMIHGELRYVRQ